MIERKTWDEFRKTGLVLIINQVLHIFGWAIVFEIEGGEIKSCYPARVKFRGFDGPEVDKSYVAISEYMKDMAGELLEEAKS